MFRRYKENRESTKHIVLNACQVPSPQTLIDLQKQYIVAMATIVTMATSIQLSEETRRELFKIVTELQAKVGRKVSYDEAIRILILQTKGVEDARRKFEDMFGILAGEKSVWADLRKLRREEEKRLERLAKSAR